MSVIPTLQRQKDRHKFKVSLSYRVKHCLKNKRKKGREMEREKREGVEGLSLQS